MEYVFMYSNREKFDSDNLGFRRLIDREFMTLGHLFYTNYCSANTYVS